MSKFIQLSVLTGLLGLASTLVACGGDEMSAEDAAKASPEDLCERMAKNFGEEPSEDEMKGCKEGMKMMEALAGDSWPKVAECLANAKSEDDADKCGEIMEKAAEELGEEMEKEMNKALEAEK